MALNLTASGFIGAGAGLTFTMAGAAILWLGWSRVANRWLGIAFAALGVRLAMFNLFRTDDETIVAGFAVALGLEIVSAVATAAYLRHELARDVPAPWRWGAVGALVAIGAFVLAAWDDRQAFAGAIEVRPAAAGLLVAMAASSLVRNVLYCGLLLVAIRRMKAQPTGVEPVLLVAIALLARSSLSAGFDFAEAANGPTYQVLLFVAQVVLFVAVLALLTVRQRPASRWAVGACLALLACALLGALLAAGLLDERGLASPLLRVASTIPLAYAIARHDLLQVPLPRSPRRASYLAGLGLAALFITAQVAQNLLNDTLGLVVGGAVAGLVVFAAFPLQKAAERRLEAGHEDTFRSAVRLALGDRILSAADERELMALAGRLQLSIPRAHAIMDAARGLRP